MSVQSNFIENKFWSWLDVIVNYDDISFKTNVKKIRTQIADRRFHVILDYHNTQIQKLIAKAANGNHREIPNWIDSLVKAIENNDTNTIIDIFLSNKVKFEPLIEWCGQNRPCIVSHTAYTMATKLNMPFPTKPVPKPYSYFQDEQHNLFVITLPHKRYFIFIANKIVETVTRENGTIVSDHRIIQNIRALTTEWCQSVLKNNVDYIFEIMVDKKEIFLLDIYFNNEDLFHETFAYRYNTLENFINSNCNTVSIVPQGNLPGKFEMLSKNYLFKNLLDNIINRKDMCFKLDTYFICVGLVQTPTLKYYFAAREMQTDIITVYGTMEITKNIANILETIESVQFRASERPQYKWACFMPNNFLYLKKPIIVVSQKYPILANDEYKLKVSSVMYDQTTLVHYVPGGQDDSHIARLTMYNNQTKHINRIDALKLQQLVNKYSKSIIVDHINQQNYNNSNSRTKAVVKRLKHQHTTTKNQINYHSGCEEA